MLTEELLSSESAESLEQAGSKNRKAFFAERLKYLGIGLLMLVFFMGLGFGMHSCESSNRTGVASGDLAGQVLSAPMDTMDFLGNLAMVGGILGGFIVVVYQLFRSIAGPPKSKKDPEATIKKYYGNCLIATGGFDSVGLDGYVCLLDTAKKEVGTLSDFKNYWTDANKKIVQEIIDLFSPENFNQTSVSIEKIDLSKKSDRIVDGKVLVKIVVKRQEQGTFGPNWQTLGDVYYSVKCQLGQVKDRWYMGSNEWSGKITKEKLS